MGRPRATAAARSRRANPKPKRSFLSPLAPAATATRKRAGSSSSPSSPNSPTDLRFVSSPGSSASPKPAPKSRSSKRTARTKPASRSPLASPRPATPLPAAVAAAAPAPAASAAVSSVGDLRSAAASQMEALKRRLDALHSRAHTDLDTSLSRASKRFKGEQIQIYHMSKTQNQVCQQLTDEMDKEYKKMSDGIKKNTEMIKAKYKQIMAEAESSTSRVRKVTIPEMTKSVEKAIDSLRSRYNISMPT